MIKKFLGYLFAAAILVVSGSGVASASVGTVINGPQQNPPFKFFPSTAIVSPNPADQTVFLGVEGRLPGITDVCNLTDDELFAYLVIPSLGITEAVITSAGPFQGQAVSTSLRAPAARQGADYNNWGVICNGDYGETQGFAINHYLDVSGVPNGTYTVTVRLTDDHQKTGSFNFTFQVQHPTVVTPPTSPLTCSLSDNEIEIGDYVTATASGGEGPISWNAPGGSPSLGGSNSSFSTRYSSLGQKTITVYKGSESKNCSVNVVDNSPTPNQSEISIKVNGTDSATISAGQTINLTWSSAFVDEPCHASGSWGGTKTCQSSTGGETVGPFAAGQTLTFSIAGLVSASAGGNGVISAQDSATVIVEAAAAGPDVDLKGNGSDGPVEISSGSSVALSWSVTNTTGTSCTVSADPTDSNWTGSKSTAGGNQTISNITQPKRFSITCTNSSGSDTDYVDVAIQSTTGTAVDLKVNGSNGPINVAAGQPLAVSWTTNGTFTSCRGWTVSSSLGAGWTGNLSTSGGTKTFVMSSTGRFYYIECTKSDGSTATDYVHVRKESTGPLSCSPVSQTVNKNQNATLTAEGGSGSISWNAPSGNPSTAGDLTTFTTKYATIGTKTVTLLRGGQQVTCSVTVTDTPGTVVVESNINTTWVVTGPQELREVAPLKQKTYTNVTPGTYSIVPANQVGYKLATITPASSQTLTSGGIIIFTLRYEPNDPVSCSPTYQSSKTDKVNTLTATGGSGSYSWSAPGGSPSSSSAGLESDSHNTTFSTSYPTTGLKTITVTDGASSATCTVDVGGGNSSPTSLPQVNLKANDSDGPITLGEGEVLTLSWTTTGAPTSCVGSATPTHETWSGTTLNPGGGSYLMGPQDKGYTFTINCSNGNGQASDNVTVDLDGDGNGSEPVVILNATPISISSGSSSLLSWSTANVDNCIASAEPARADWVGAKSVANDSPETQTVGPLTAETLFTLTCFAPVGQSSDTAQAVADVTVSLGERTFYLSHSQNLGMKPEGGTSSGANIIITPLFGYQGEVTLSGQSSVPGLSFNFGTPVVSFKNGNSQTSTLTVTKNGAIARDTYNLTIVGTDGSGVQRFTYPLLYVNDAGTAGMSTTSIRFEEF